MVRAAGSDVAFVHGLARMGAVGQLSMWLRVTLGLCKRDGAWQITCEHESVPRSAWTTSGPRPTWNRDVRL